ncbi:MAG: hypothetical protein HY318_19300 [Armatimonadetes bacterium]|nr:hypothetical protein [Armatimonadota bacterium]
MRRFEVRNPAKYAQGLTAATSALLSKLQISTPYGLCNYPSVSISNGMVHATILLPDRISGYYRGSRFDWSGMVAQIVYHGHTFTREWLVPHDPTRSDNAIGLAEEFGTGTAGMPGPPGYEEAKPGETFMKIGVGLLERVDESHYRFGYDYRILQPGTWQTRTGKRWVEFSQEMKQERGWGYRYTKRVHLSPSRPELRITHTLTNLGAKTINQNHYCHNFLSIDREPIGPGYRLTFPFKVSLERDPGPLAEVIGRSILFHETPLEGHAAFSALTGFSTAARDNAVTVENTKSGAEVRIQGTQAPCRFQVFATHRVVCPEPFILITLLPGQTTSWMTRYTFSERKPHSDKS